ncbi:tumor necrosis factor receptor superfamily member 11A-like [Scleropages formosus]|uniref:Tumor necrosis factor receptor superfamily, member 11a, NFKB activator n=1 Tax=Scleropages formosus TaxID=113540 RepID=A0A8C9VCJ1_SCLFO|nr:tumor necrosis factor receptor superfamily member 11A [Scleropages formosus]
MRVLSSTLRIPRAWISHLVIAACAQVASPRPTCSSGLYANNRCCRRCDPGTYQFAQCTADEETKCRPCGQNEYLPYANNESKCLLQKICDPVKGFIQESRVNRTAAVPCRCKPGYQCSLINCEFCVKIEKCQPGFGFVTNEGKGTGTCLPCKNGYYSNISSTEPCKPWTDCKVLGKTEKQPGSDKSDSQCGAIITGASSLWVVVAVLSLLVLVSLVVLFLLCCKEKLKPLSGNLRTCVQNLKQSRVQQEMAPYSSPSGPLNRSLLHEGNLHDASDVGPGDRAPAAKLAVAGESCRLAPAEAKSEPPSYSGSAPCSCAFPVRGPLEVGENEDCSQAVAPGVCSCGAETVQKRPPCEDCRAEPQGSCDPGRDPGVQVTGRGGERPGTRTDGDDRQNEPCCCSEDSTTGPLLSLECEEDAGRSPQGGSERKLPACGISNDPVPLHAAQSLDTPMASGRVSGNNNTAFISSGQVMNFSGDVIVVYVSQGSQGAGETQEEAFGNPVQEESGDGAFRAQSKADAGAPLRDPALRYPPATQRSLPVQEESNEWPQHKLL